MKLLTKKTGVLAGWLLAMTIASVTEAMAQSLLTADQRENLRVCIRITEEMRNDPEIVCPIMLVESSAVLDEKSLVGDMQLSPFKRSYGIMQVRLPTLKLIIKKLGLTKYRSVPDEILLSKLMFDKEFGIKAANWYITWLKRRGYGKKYMYAVAYNSGVYRKSNVSYKKRYMDALRTFRRFVREENTGNVSEIVLSSSDSRGDR